MSDPDTRSQDQTTMQQVDTFNQVLWQIILLEKAFRETKEEIKAKYPHLFVVLLDV